MSLAIGIAACGVSALFFGCQFVPIKSYNAGDGIFVQFIISVVIFAIGFCVHVYEGFPQFYPLAMLGGLFWTCGNSTGRHFRTFHSISELWEALQSCRAGLILQV